MSSALYRRRRDKIRARIAAKTEPINVLFFVTSMSMWRYHELFFLMNASRQFRPLIVPYFTPKTDLSIMRSNRDAIAAYAAANSFPFRDGFDFTSLSYSDLKDFNPDIVIYSQPYDWGYPDWGIRSFSRNSLFVYTAYGAVVAEGKHFRDTPLCRVASWIFVGSESEKEVFGNDLPVNREVITVVGSEIFQKINNPVCDPWPKTGRKRVIWAPHHSIDDHNSFASSFFEQLAAPMLEIAEKYRNEIDFAFKPHPLLRSRLYEKWGKERTDAYYRRWSFIADGEYTDLFAHSDAIIHDCSSFVAEYLYTAKPALYVTDSETPGVAVGNKFGHECFSLHYHGHTPRQIEQFLTDTVLQGNDPLRPQRLAFREKLRLPDSPGKKMLAALSQI
ncbi:MAG: CDP-glycerol glycerophosphotransferase family protein [Bacteroides sp.]|nr:CDP-glycerol glycerophosphotransferase family protein [Bacteroides sp.]MCM1379786.1 CDP-glycerol glycerophosphotransferase family protein [Bacteroides sp.]MCM1446145.1 CDP-glycerol glycerophosphotransferase family protein [Prevotella sp.]